MLSSSFILYHSLSLWSSDANFLSTLWHLKFLTSDASFFYIRAKCKLRSCLPTKFLILFRKRTFIFENELLPVISKHRSFLVKQRQWQRNLFASLSYDSYRNLKWLILFWKKKIFIVQWTFRTVRTLRRLTSS